MGHGHDRTGGTLGNVVLLFVTDLDIRVVHRDTGELLTQLTLDPNRNYQPQAKK